ncbi:G5 domain-containing protein [Dolosigranulum pigrum]
MLGKNNKKERINRLRNKKIHYTIKKLKVGVGSVVVGASLVFGSEAVLAEEQSNATTEDTKVETTYNKVTPKVDSEKINEAVEASVTSTEQLPTVEEKIAEPASSGAEEPVLETEEPVGETELTQPVGESEKSAASEEFETLQESIEDPVTTEKTDLVDRDELKTQPRANQSADREYDFEEIPIINKPEPEVDNASIEPEDGNSRDIDREELIKSAERDNILKSELVQNDGGLNIRVEQDGPRLEDQDYIDTQINQRVFINYDGEKQYENVILRFKRSKQTYDGYIYDFAVNSGEFSRASSNKRSDSHYYSDYKIGTITPGMNNISIPFSIKARNYRANSLSQGTNSDFKEEFEISLVDNNGETISKLAVTYVQKAYHIIPVKTIEANVKPPYKSSFINESGGSSANPETDPLKVGSWDNNPSNYGPVNFSEFQLNWELKSDLYSYEFPSKYFIPSEKLFFEFPEGYEIRFDGGLPAQKLTDTDRNIYTFKNRYYSTTGRRTMNMYVKNTNLSEKDLSGKTFWAKLYADNPLENSETLLAEYHKDKLGWVEVDTSEKKLNIRTLAYPTRTRLSQSNEIIGNFRRLYTKEDYKELKPDFETTITGTTLDGSTTPITKINFNNPSTKDFEIERFYFDNTFSDIDFQILGITENNERSILSREAVLAGEVSFNQFKEFDIIFDEPMHVKRSVFNVYMKASEDATHEGVTTSSNGTLVANVSFKKTELEEVTESTHRFSNNTNNKYTLQDIQRVYKLKSDISLKDERVDLNKSFDSKISIDHSRGLPSRVNQDVNNYIYEITTPRGVYIDFQDKKADFEKLYTIEMTQTETGGTNYKFIAKEPVTPISVEHKPEKLKYQMDSDVLLNSRNGYVEFEIEHRIDFEENDRFKIDAEHSKAVRHASVAVPTGLTNTIEIGSSRDGNYYERIASVPGKDLYMRSRLFNLTDTPVTDRGVIVSLPRKDGYNVNGEKQETTNSVYLTEFVEPNEKYDLLYTTEELTSESSIDNVKFVSEKEITNVQEVTAVKYQLKEGVQLRPYNYDEFILVGQLTEESEPRLYSRVYSNLFNPNELINLGSINARIYTNYKTISVNEITEPFDTVKKEDASLPVGVSKTIIDGRDGLVKERTGQWTLYGEAFGEPKVIDSEVITKKIDEEVLVGTGVLPEVTGNDPLTVRQGTGDTDLTDGITITDKNANEDKDVTAESTIEILNIEEINFDQPGEYRVNFRVRDLDLKEEYEDQAYTTFSRIVRVQEVEFRPSDELEFGEKEDRGDEEGKRIILVGNQYIKAFHVPAPIERIPDVNLAHGEVVVEQEGKDGLERVTYGAFVDPKTGELGQALKMSTETVYSPEKRVERIGVRPSSDVVETFIETLQYETIMIEDPNLYVGMQVVETEGRLGQSVVETPLVFENGKLVKDFDNQTVETIDAIDKVVRVGTKQLPNFEAMQFELDTIKGVLEEADKQLQDLQASDNIQQYELDTIKAVLQDFELAINNSAGDLAELIQLVSELDGRIAEELEDIRESTLSSLKGIAETIEANEEALKENLDKIRKNIQTEKDRLEELTERVEANEGNILRLEQDILDMTDDILNMTNDLDHLDSRVTDIDAALQQEITVRKEAINNLYTEINNIKLQIVNNEGDIEELEQTLATLRANLEAEKNRINDLAERVSENAANIEAINENLDGLNEQTAELEQLINQVETNVSELDEALQQEITVRKEAINNLYTEINNIKLQIVNNEGDIEELEQILATLRANLEAEKNRINDLAERVSENEGNITDLDKEVKTLENYLDKEIEDRIKDVNELQTEINRLANIQVDLSEELQQEIINRKEAVNNLYTEIENIKVELTQSGSDIEAFERQLAELKAELQAEITRTNNLSKRVSENEAQIKGLVDRADKIEQDATQLTKHVVELEGKLHGLDAKVIQELAERKQSIISIAVQIFNIKQELQLSTKDIAELERKLVELSAELAAEKERLSNVIKRVNEHDERITDLEKRTNAVETVVSRLTGRIAELELTVGLLSDQLKQEVENRKQAVSNLKDQITELKQELRVTTEDRAKLERKLADLEANLEAEKARINDLSQRVNENKANIDVLGHRTDKLESNANHLAERVTELENRVNHFGGALKDEVEQRKQGINEIYAEIKRVKESFTKATSDVREELMKHLDELEKALAEQSNALIQLDIRITIEINRLEEQNNKVDNGSNDTEKLGSDDSVTNSGNDSDDQDTDDVTPPTDKDITDSDEADTDTDTEDGTLTEPETGDNSEETVNPEKTLETDVETGSDSDKSPETDKEIDPKVDPEVETDPETNSEVGADPERESDTDEDSQPNVSLEVDNSKGSDSVTDTEEAQPTVTQAGLTGSTSQTQGELLPATATGAWTLGLIGLTSMGLGGVLSIRRKDDEE